MRFHVLSLPHTATNKDYPNNICAYTQKVVNFTAMMMAAGHDVTLYGGPEEDNEARCTEYVEVITREEKYKWFDPPYPEKVPVFTPDQPGFAIFNENAGKGIAERKRQGDIICQFGGTSQAPVSDWNKDLITVEAGIGYTGIFSDYKVFESYAWMHTVYGIYTDWDKVPDGQPLDTVIPNSYNINEFPLGKGDGGYVLFMGRVIERKGVRIAEEVAKRAGKKLLVAGGQGNVELTYGEPVGQVGPEARAELMGGAEAVLVPTIYTEPFGGVAVESMLCGTPVLTTDWGAFTETVDNGLTGWRCRTMGEFAWGLKHAGDLDRLTIQAWAQRRYSTEAAKHLYNSYFDRVMHESEERRPGR